MTLYRSLLPSVAALALLAGCNKSETTNNASAGEGAAALKQDAASVYPDWAAGPAPAPQSTVDKRAIQAIQDMSRYLGSLKTLKLDTVGTIDVVTADGQRLQLDGTTSYEAKRPGLKIHYVSDLKTRDFFYDGKNFTVYSPTLGFYATEPAPGTNRELLDMVYNKYGIKLPLEDLFRWNDEGVERIKDFRAAADLGTVTLDGVKTTHYAFREPEVDWEIWIDQGDKPLPRKLTIVDRTDPARPAFTSRMKWTVNPPLNPSDFTFTPKADSKRIQLAQFEG